MKYSKYILLKFFLSFILFFFNNTATADHHTPQRQRTSALVLMTDFGIQDGAVAAMKGVAYGVNSEIKMFDLTHGIAPYNIWEGAYRLYQVINFWEKGTVFVNVIDPGVGTERTSIVAKSKSGHYFVNPNNGLLTLIDDVIGIDEIRIIDEKINRLPYSYDSYTFHGRDLYVYTGSRLASNVITFEQVGTILPLSQLVKIPYQKAMMENNTLKGMIPVIDSNYGNIWTNIPKKLFDNFNPTTGKKFVVKIYKNNKMIYSNTLSYQNTFNNVPPGQELIYLNSLMEISLAINMGNFSKSKNILSGIEWTVDITPY